MLDLTDLHKQRLAEATRRLEAAFENAIARYSEEVATSEIGLIAAIKGRLGALRGTEATPPQDQQEEQEEQPPKQQTSNQQSNILDLTTPTSETHDDHDD